MKIKYFNLNRFNLNYLQLFQNSIKEFLSNNYMVLGEPVFSFERSYSIFNEVDYCSGVSNGLSTIILCLKFLNIGPGDEVIVPSNIYIVNLLSINPPQAKSI